MSPTERIEVIQRSLRCFVLGLSGLVPVLGLPLAVRALFEYRRVQSQKLADWNPAGNYLGWGAAFGLVGCCITLLIGTAVAMAIWLETWA